MTELPIFPLHAVLCPGIALPLHVFEPRYRAMIGRCIKEHSPLGIVRIRSGREVGMAHPEVEQVATLAEIREVKRYEDGRFDLVVVGSSRIRIRRLRVVPDGYLVAVADAIDDVLGDQARARDLAASAGEEFIRYLELLRPAEGESGGEVEVEVEIEGQGDLDVEGGPEGTGMGAFDPAFQPVEPSESGPGPESKTHGGRDRRLDEIARRLTVPDDPTVLSHLLSGIVQVEAVRRQALLEAPTTEARLERLVSLLRRENFLLERRLTAFVADSRLALSRRN